MKQISLHIGQLSGRARRVACVRPAAASFAWSSWLPAAYATRMTAVVVLAHSSNPANATVPAADAGFMGTDPVATKRPARHLATRST